MPNNTVESRIIVALDVPPARAQELVLQTKDRISIFKVGPVLWLEWGAECLQFFHDQSVRVMIDLKFHDIPNTVQESLAALQRAKGSEAIWGLTLHALGGFSMLRSAALQADRWGAARPKLLAVTVLTSLLEKDLYRVGVNRSVEAQVKKLAQLALDAGMDGVVASVKEIEAIRKTCGREMTILTPGIQLEAFPKRSLDQKRVATPAEALESGSDYLIVGRDIYQAPDPKERLNDLIGAMKTAKMKIA